MKPLDLNFPAKTEGGEAALHPLAMRLVGHAERQERMIRTLAGKLGQRPETPPTFAEERRLAAELARRPADAVELERQRVLQRAVDEAYFTAEMHSANCWFTGLAAGAMNSFAPVMRFPNGSISSASINAAARSLWPLTRPRITLWYTSPVGSTATFNLRFSVVFFGVGTTTTAPAVSLEFTAAGPALANDILTISAVHPAANAFKTAPFGVAKFQLFRNIQGEDANVNDLDVLLALVTLEEVA